MPRRTSELRIAIDTGGTFTDCIWVDPSTHHLRMLKVFSTPANPAQAIVEAIRRITSKTLHTNFILLHGTTVGTNALLERKGARVALVTTAGFEDAIEIGRQARPKLYDFFFDRIEPLVPKDLRFGIRERTATDGHTLTAPIPEDLQSLATKIGAQSPQSIAISLLFSFANSRNEETVAESLVPLGVPLSISHQILPEFREYGRTSTIVIDAYLQPVMQSYLENLAHQTSGSDPGCNVSAAATVSRGTSGVGTSVEDRRFSAAKSSERDEASPPGGNIPRIFVMQSSGGITALDTAAREPVRTVLSGPAGGVVGAAASARASGFQNIIAFDMGGTSTDVSLVEGEIKTATDAHIAGLPIGVPMLDIHTVGAGGGSLARFDAAGVLRVGPESAGADPGPICYGRGLQPTVTDANLLLGRLQPANFLGGNFTLDLDRTRAIAKEWLNEQNSNLSLETFAEGVIRVVNTTMEKAIRVVSIERGRDPRQFVLVAFGGAGGLHACALAEALRIPNVIIPAFPGALSALGILASEAVKDYSRTMLWPVANKLPYAQLDREFSVMEKTAAADFRSESWSGKARFKKNVDVRYRGQGYELNIPFTRNLLRDFHQEHRRRYSYTYDSWQVELVTLRLRATIEPSKAHDMGTTPAIRQGPSGDSPRLSGRAKLCKVSASEAPVLFDGKELKTKIYSRDHLIPAQPYSGPAIVTEYSATTVIPRGYNFHVDQADNLVVRVRSAGKSHLGREPLDSIVKIR